MSSNRRLFLALMFFFGILSLGTTGYVLMEDHTLAEGLYMSIITISTVGFGEIKPLSEAGRAFTMLLIILGFITLAFTGHTLAESLLEKVWSGKSRLKKMKKRISQLNQHYIICGFGRMGAAAPEHLLKAGSEFVVIEADPARCLEIQEEGFLHIEGDATRESVLLQAGIKKASGLVALLNSDPENLFIVLTARELNPTLHIISRAEDVSSKKKILRAGADSIILPFATAGKQVAEDILIATGKTTASVFHPHQPQNTPYWISVSAETATQNQTILSITDPDGSQVLGLRRNGRDILLPDPDTTLESGDEILVLRGTGDLQPSLKRPKVNPKKLVIIDDNPVILGLYTRLFQKAGFHPLTAINGREGLDLIIHEKPHAAVIDFMLPVLRSF
ncbi:MAG: hypothetical protein B6240_11345 [Desulfobacteraceae bacterium 4572_87]|nr:MAG: hypothetical protein B6240_11345 [Desulfobacteraceae bacterium 4572_87]